ncbi:MULTISPECIES: helix-turn-helix transcriptional regulator [unclassified Klebsiella]|uniref:helix-turn-helix transcriptional regulator n=1 Tax=unclassified Klebsiella TaxID=2608929 RepID=UPI001D1875FF|nr:MULTISPECIES: helix-turn-helix transcriptional regulator [unclassified Klebsiella]
MLTMWNTDHFFEKIDTTLGVDYMLRAREGVPDEGVYIQPHMHLEHEVMWFHKAQGSYSLGNEKFAIKNNTLVYVSPLMLHDMELNFTADHERFLLQYDNAILSKLKYPFPMIGSQVGVVIQLNEREAERLQFIFKWFAEIHEAPHSVQDVNPVMILLLNTVLSHASHAELVSAETENGTSFENIINFIIEMETKTSFNITLDEASASVGLSPSHFSRTFKKIMQVSFKEYLVRKKIAMSASLLTNTELNITEIAYQCEFTDSAYYCFQFKKIVGVTPKRFRINSRTSRQLSTNYDALS